ncbi:hypothetical protein B0H13DRAFT_1034841 [Mycena leptocephala]|nr:hypothetical protein B0H13DRAFT_1034841 [Mycena leptocephala]
MTHAAHGYRRTISELKSQSSWLFGLFFLWFHSFFIVQNRSRHKLGSKNGTVGTRHVTQLPPTILSSLFGLLLALGCVFNAMGAEAIVRYVPDRL